MSETEMTWGNITWGTWYHIAAQSGPHSHVKDIVFPYAAGRDYMWLGDMQDDQTAFSCVFAEEGDFRNRLVAADLSTLNTLETSIRTASKANAVYDLVTYAGTWTAMRLAAFSLGPLVVALNVPSGYQYQRPFTAQFVQYY